MSASVTDLRTFAATAGIPFAERGRPSVALVEAFNKGKRGNARFVPNAPTLVKVEAKPPKGRKVVRMVDVEQVRQAALDAGVKVGARGPLREAVLKASVLGTLSDLAETPATV